MNPDRRAPGAAGREAGAGEGEGPGDPGLCGACRHGIPQASARGSVFWRCRRAESDSRFLRYPPLPVRACEGFGPTEGGC